MGLNQIKQLEFMMICAKNIFNKALINIVLLMFWEMV